MNIEEILNEIEKKQTISIGESFDYAKICLIKLRESEKEGYKLLITVLDNFNKIPDKTKNIWADIIEMAGFYPYLKKERLSLNSVDSKIRKEFHQSKHLEDVYFHEEQKILTYILESEKNLIVSAPTSFGKSLLIEEIVASKKYKNIVIIQPTLALLDETRKKLKKYKDFYKIILKTSQEAAKEKGNLFLLTAERVLEYPVLPKIDFLIIDEFYKLSQKRDDERAYILNNSFYKILKEHSPRFYLLGPNIDGISEGFANKYNAIFYKTNYSLVESKIIDIYTKHQKKFKHPRKYKGYKEKVLFELLHTLGFENKEQVIIYCSSPKRVRDLAWKFYLFLIDEKKLILNNNLPLNEWIEKYIDPKWNLIELLKFKIGINDGALIKHINSSIVDYFNDERLSFLFCTTTLIEGVNTSAKNIVFFDNKKGNRKLIDFFDYSNIKGRAGRFMIHYIGKIYNFNSPPKKEEKMIIDIPFFQQKPIEDEVLITLDKEDLLKETQESEQYKKIAKLSDDEKELFKKNSVSVWGQKRILEQLEKDINTKQDIIKWSGIPKYEQLKYILFLAWDNLIRQGETTKPMTKKQLVKLTFDYTINKNINYLIELTYLYFKEKKKFPKYNNNELYNEAIRQTFNIFRHWFQFKVPKWLNVVNNLQKFVCQKNGLQPGDYSYYASLLENDFVDEKLSILLEYGIPTTAIKKIEQNINIKNINENNLMNEINKLLQNKRELFLSYEIEKIKNAF